MKSRFFIFILLMFSTQLFSQSWQWAKTFNSSAGIDGNIGGLTANTLGNIFISAGINNLGGVVIGVDTLPATNSVDALVIKYDANGNEIGWKLLGGSDIEVGQGIAVNQYGEIYVSGKFRGDTLTFDNIQILTPASHGNFDDLFLAKLDTAGNCSWVKTYGMNGEESCYELLLDDSGYVYMAAMFEDSIRFDSIVLYGDSLNRDICIVKFDPNGNVIWGVSAGSDTYDYCSALCVADSGNVIVTGYFSGLNFRFGNDTLPGNGALYELFTLKISKDGDPVWMKTITGAGNDNFAYDVASDSRENIYIIGGYHTQSFGPAPFTLINPDQWITPTGNVFLAKYDPAGNLLRLQSFGDIFNDEGTGIKVDQYDNVFVAGNYEDTIQLGSLSASCDGKNIFVAKLDSAGNVLAAKDGSGPNLVAYVEKLILDKDEMPVVFGSFKNSIQFGGQTLTAPMDFDDYIAKLSMLSTEINEQQKINEVIVYPNPSAGIINFHSTVLIDSKFSVYSVTGSLVFQTELNNDKKVDLSTLIDGIYFYQLFKSDLSQVTGKLFLQK